MCKKCDELQKQIAQYERFLNQIFDPLTQERMKAALAELQKRKAELHWAPQFASSPLILDEILIYRIGVEAFRHLRHGSLVTGV
jgi:hypothetical protein